MREAGSAEFLLCFADCWLDGLLRARGIEVTSGSLRPTTADGGKKCLSH